MVKKTECPGAEVLADFVGGRLADPELNELSEHLEDCADCQERAKTLAPHDTLVEALRGESPLTDAIAQDIPRPLVEKIKKLAESQETNSSDTVVHPAESVPQTARTDVDFLSAAQQPDEIGRLGAYRILKVLGKGGMGMVFLAHDPELDRLVALKVMLPKITAFASAKTRFLREARAAAKLRNDHIVTIFQVSEDHGVPFLAMELLDGMPLDQLLQSGRRLTLTEILRIGREIAQGLAAAHEKGLVHRDIKPANLWLDRAHNDRVKILDFGLARHDEDDVQITQSGAIVGTPAYMAPEQGRGEKNVDARADLFSLGCVLYRLCAGDIPFKAETTIGVLTALAVHAPTPPHDISDAIPQSLSELIMLLLEKEPTRRPATAKEVITRLAEIERNLPAGDGATATAEFQRKPSAGASTTVGLQQTNDRPSRRRRPITIALACAFLVGIIALSGGIFYLVTDNGTLEIKTADKNVKVIVEEDGGKVTILDPLSKQTWILNTGKYTIRLDGNPDSLEIDLPKDRTFAMKRGDIQVVSIRKIDRVVVGKTPESPPPIPDGFALEFDGSTKVDLPMIKLGETAPLTLEAYVSGRGDDKNELTGRYYVVAVPGQVSLKLSPKGNPEGGVATNEGVIAIWAPPFPAERRLHLAVVHSGTEWRLYVDGRLWATKEIKATLVPITDHFVIGQGLKGFISEVRISKTVRYDKEFTPKARFETDADTLALYHFGEGTGDKLTDSSGNGHHGKIVGATWVKADGRPILDPKAPLSPLDALGPQQIPAAERFDWQPKELVAVVGTHQQRHRSAVASVKYSRDGKWMVSSCGGNGDATICLWQAESMRRVATFNMAAAITFAAFSPDSKTLAFGYSQKPEIRFVDLGGAVPVELPALRGFPLGAAAVAYSPDGKMLAQAASGVIYLWEMTDPKSPKKRHELKTENYHGLAFSPNGKILASWGRTAVQSWDLDAADPKDLGILFQSKTNLGSPGVVAFHPDGKSLVVLDRSGQTVSSIALDVTKGTSSAPVLISQNFLDYGFSISRDGLFAVAGSVWGLGSIHLIDPKDPAKNRRFPKDLAAGFASVDFSPDAKSLVTGGWDGVVRVWDITVDPPVERFPVEGAVSRVTSVAFTPRDKALWTASHDGAVRSWKLGGAQPELDRTIPMPAGLVSNFVLAVGEQPRVAAFLDYRPNQIGTKEEAFWSLADKAPKKIARFATQGTLSYNVAMTPRGDVAVYAGRGAGILQIVDFRKEPVEERVIKLGKKSVAAVIAISPNGRFVACGGNKELFIWDLSVSKPGPRLHSFPLDGSATGLTFSPDSRMLAASAYGDGSIRLYELEGTPKALAKLPGVGGTSFNQMAFSPNRNLLALATGNGIAIIDLKNFNRDVLRWSVLGLQSFAFAEDNRHLAVGLSNGTTYILRMGISQKSGKLPSETKALYPGDSVLEFYGTLDGERVDVPGFDFTGMTHVTVEGYIRVRPMPTVFGPPNFLGVAGQVVLMFNRDANEVELASLGNGNRAKAKLPTLDEWVHVAGVRAGDKAILFVNGKKVGEVKHNNIPMAAVPHAFKIGGASFIGRIREVRVSKGAKYSDDFKPDERPKAEPDTLALYHCDEGRGTKLIDSSGNNRHGTIVGTMWVKKDGAPILDPLAKTAFPPLDPAWASKVCAMKAKDQAQEFENELKRRNPNFDGKVKPEVRDEIVTGLTFLTDEVTDITPIRVFSGLKKLVCRGSGLHNVGAKGKLSDLSPLRGLKLTYLDIYGLPVTDLSPLVEAELAQLHADGATISDFAPLKGQPLTVVWAGGRHMTDLSSLAGTKLNTLVLNQTGVTDLTPLAGLPLLELRISNSPIRDLTPLKGLVRLETLAINGTKVEDLSPIAGLPLRTLAMQKIPCEDYSPLLGKKIVNVNITYNPWRDADWLRALPEVKNISQVSGLGSEAIFWKEQDAVRAKFDSWVKEVQGMKPEEQVKAVVAELKKRNPKFDVKTVTPSFAKTGEVIALKFSTDTVTDISPVRALPKLKALAISGSAPGAGKLRDLWPLRGLPLTDLTCGNNQITDLLALTECKLTKLEAMGNPIRDVGVRYVGKMKTLKQLDLTATHITPDGATKLKGYVPKLIWTQVPEQPPQAEGNGGDDLQSRSNVTPHRLEFVQFLSGGAWFRHFAIDATPRAIDHTRGTG